jgi:hypothetical protein
MNRKEFLGRVDATINGQREDDYGAPEQNLGRIAELWSTYLRMVVRPGDVAAMMALLKIARLSKNIHHDDSWLDLAGYAAIGAEITSEDEV